ncbi:OmpH family outer membrane protein [Aurantiacibacter poecillastricola]|uniref:OmpH family outer membrane protein n=1 Tax=Aurantiacibacter poecillastricola TaxID=3064385 RepID=UPI00273F5127|nr:OmpH family outer membrane protein [Aurantiacibacter sp. 219JJ12-13]MDP5262706.1 OmpH family outer membrane protein [Aurantiacibacter sp. 219JJ12-13]
MTFTLNTAMKAALAAAGVALATPAAAQVNGMATADITAAVIGSQAFQTGFQQISTQYESQRSTIEQRQQQRQQLIQTFDTNGDGQLDQTEQQATQDASNTTVQQIQAIDREMSQLQQPINRARVYVVQQVAQNYSAALQQVISDNNIQFVISPDALVYGPEAADITSNIVTALNTRVPSAQITPPADWQPSEAAVNLYQQIQQLLMISAMQQQQQAAGGQQAPATTGR